MSNLRVAHFTVHGTAAQSVRWNQAAEAEGFNSTGSWLACAADAYLRMRARAGAPLPLAWYKGRFKVRLEDDGEDLVVRGHLSPPFGIFKGDAAGHQTVGARLHRLVYLPTSRVLATMAHTRDARRLAGELARVWARGKGSEPDTDVRAVLESAVSLL